MDSSPFSEVLFIWIRKPHVVNPKIFAAEVSDQSVIPYMTRTVIPTKRSQRDPFVEEIRWSDSGCTFSSDHGSYTIRLEGDQVAINVTQIHGDFFSEDWFMSVLQRKLNTWMKQEAQSLTVSLRLVDTIYYQETYERLKAKYASGIIQNWCEKTDPLKFTYEDLGIAAYLIVLWKNQSNVYFMDVGCGNGLLVYLLITEGFKGVGVDIRRRRIWNTYPELVSQSLHELTLDPEQSPGFPEVNWLIGNHSDELTPWLPVLAVRSGPQCHVFALPCCPFGLFGKYNNFMHPTATSGTGDSDSSTTVTSEKLVHNRYGIYVHYLRGLFTACGFMPETDILRIPSTRRVCIIGRSHSVHLSDHAERLASVRRAVERERLASAAPNSFVPRDRKDPVRNCTQIEANVKQTVSDLVFRALLDKPPDRLWLDAQNLVFSDSLSIQTVDGRWWNPGGQLTLLEASMLLTTDQLKLMKSQHGGLQTLLRNHHQTFEIRNGLVRLRCALDRMARSNAEGQLPVPLKSARKRPLQRKSKPCWMLTHHPDGCPYPSEMCDFSHSTPDDLHQSPSSRSECRNTVL